MSRLEPEQIDALSKLANLKGAPLSIIVAMLIARRPLMARQLKTYTGFANGAITAGLKALEDLQAVVNLGRPGWMLAPNWQQLSLPLHFAEVNHDFRDHAEVNHENRDLPIDLSSGSSSNLRKTDPPTNHHGDGDDHDFRDLPEQSANYGEITPSKKTAPEITARSGGPEITAVAYWLNRAGIEAASYHWEKILAMGHKPEYVKSHVLELLAGQDGLPGAEEIKTGALIYRLEHNWKSPVMRCEECLKRERECRCGRSLHNQIPDRYKDIIKR